MWIGDKRPPKGATIEEELEFYRKLSGNKFYHPGNLMNAIKLMETKGFPESSPFVQQFLIEDRKERSRAAYRQMEQDMARSRREAEVDRLRRNSKRNGERAALFRENPKLWSPGPPKTALQLMELLLDEHCPGWREGG